MRISVRNDYLTRTKYLRLRILLLFPDSHNEIIDLAFIAELMAGGITRQDPELESCRRWLIFPLEREGA